MPQEDDNPTEKHEPSPTPHSVPESRSWFTTPKLIKRLFDNFPLQTLPANDLPLRTAQARHKHTLYIFTTVADAKAGAPSFNPSCLKWQTYLKFVGLDFTTVSSNNHASPSGALPFLQPASSSTDAPTPIPFNKLQKWAGDQKLSVTESESMRYEAYLSLLDHRIRNAWLYNLYLSSHNFSSVAAPLYINSATSSLPVRLALSHTLCSAARSELLKQGAVIDSEALYAEATAAFSALSTLLGKDDYFFGAKQPGLFDASVFAYTHLLLDDELGWQERRLSRSVQECGNLVRHRKRIYKGYFVSKG